MDQGNLPIYQLGVGIAALDCPAFKEKFYAYYFTRASFSGSKICFFQRSYEAPGLFYMFIKIFSQETPEVLGYKLLLNEKFSSLEVKQIYIYIAGFLTNCGNYLSFGDKKFVPEICKEKFWSFITQTKAYQQDKENFDKVWNLVNFGLYHYQQPHSLIDLAEKGGNCFIPNLIIGQNSYYSPTLSQAFLENLDKLMQEKNLSVINTRVVKRDDRVEVLVASKEIKVIKDWGVVDGISIDVVYGDFSKFLGGVVENLQLAKSFTSSNEQDHMLTQYIAHFQDGDMDKHKESQKHWIQDKGPIVETNIGFIETYLDPLKVRAEFEGFVSFVNQEESLILNKLVSNAETFIAYLPWPKVFELEKFTKIYFRPDFTSLEVLAFACSGTPIGINIPNYDDIRQNFGFKNVNLGNVYGKPTKERIRFLSETDTDLLVKYYQKSLFVVVALHELIGHGSGKLLMQDQDGKLNYDPEAVIDPFTNEKVNSFYKHNENWHHRFGELSGAYEECKADAVALYLSTYDDVVDVLLPGMSQEEKHEAVYVGWLEIIQSGFKGLEYYSPEQSKWGQPHILASYVLLQTLLQEDPDMVKVDLSERDNKPYLTVTLDRQKIWTVGRRAIGNLLKGLQVYKSIGAGKEGLDFFNKYTVVDEKMLSYRTIVLQHKVPRKLELQCDLKKVNHEVELVTFDESIEGVINSQVYHYQGQVDDVLELFLTTQQLFKPIQD